MKALMLDSPGKLAWRDVRKPTASSREALVRVRRCLVGDCDVRAFSGGEPALTYPRRLGHEVCVEIVSSPDPAFRRGDLCAVDPYFACGQCSECLAGKRPQCRSRLVLGLTIDGGFSHFLRVPTENLHLAPGLNPDQIAQLDFLVCGAHVVECGGITPQEAAVVCGLTQAGMAAAIFVQHARARIALVDNDQARLRFACAQLHLESGFRPGTNLGYQLRTHFGESPVLVIAARSDLEATREAMRLAGETGRLIFLGACPGDEIFHFPDFSHWELNRAVSRADRRATRKKVISLLASRQIDERKLITHRWAFAATAERMPEFCRAPGLVEGLIDFD